MDPAPASGGDLDAFIDREIAQRLAKHPTWKQLELCFKWQKTVEYMESCGIKDTGCETFLRVKEMIRSNKLKDVEYDASNGKVVKLGVFDI